MLFWWHEGLNPRLALLASAHLFFFPFFFIILFLPHFLLDLLKISRGGRQRSCVQTTFVTIASGTATRTASCCRGRDAACPNASNVIAVAEAEKKIETCRINNKVYHKMKSPCIRTQPSLSPVTFTARMHLCRPLIPTLYIYLAPTPPLRVRPL